MAPGDTPVLFAENAPVRRSGLSEQDRRVSAYFQALLRDLVVACLDANGRRRAPSSRALRRAINALPKVTPR